MSEEYTGSKISFVSKNQFVTVHDKLRSRIEEHDQHIDAIDQKINSIVNAMNFAMNTVGDLKSKSEKMCQSIDDMARIFDADHIRIRSLDTMVDTDH